MSIKQYVVGKLQEVLGGPFHACGRAPKLPPAATCSCLCLAVAALSARCPLCADYVEGLTAENLEMQLFSGVIEQRNLRLKKAALSKLKLPIEVLSGYLGLLSVTVPWRNLSTERVVITIEEVCLVAVPNRANASEGSLAEDVGERLAMLAAELEQRIQVRSLSLSLFGLAFRPVFEAIWGLICGRISLAVGCGA